MKTKSFLALAVIMLFTFASCKKDYTCTCTFRTSSTGPLQTEAQAYEETTRGDAKEACDQYEAQLLNFGRQEVDCKLK